MNFKIIGGSFGLNGTLSVKDCLEINSLKKATYEFSDVVDIVIEKRGKEKKTSCLSVIVGIIITIPLVILFSFIGLSYIGLLIGFLITYFGSIYYVQKTPQATIRLRDNKTVVIIGRQMGLESLMPLVS